MDADLRRFAILAVVCLLAPPVEARSSRVWIPGEETPAPKEDLGPQHLNATKLGEHRYSERFSIERIAVAADGSEIAALTRASREGAKSWDLGSGRSLQLPPLHRDAATLGWSPAKDLLAVSVRADVLSGERSGVALVRMSDGSSAGFLEGGDTCSTLAFSPDGAQLACASAQGVLLWGLPNGRPTTVLPEPATTVSWAAASELLVALDGGAKLMRVAIDGKTLDAWSGKRTTSPLVFSPDGQFAAIGAQGHVRIVNLREGGDPQKLPLPGAVSALGWSMSGRVLAAGTDEGLLHVFAVEGAGGLDFSKQPATPDRGGRAVRAQPPDAEPSRSEPARDEARYDDLGGAADPLDRGAHPTSGRDGGGGGGGLGGPELTAELSVLVLEQMGGDPREGATIEAALRKNIKRLEPCWKKQARQGKLGAGKLVLELGVTPNGEGVAVATPLQDELKNDKLLECLGERLREPLLGSGLGSLQIELTIDLRVR